MIKVFAVGRLTKDATVFHYNTSNGQNSGVSFTIASNRFGGDDKADFINCTIFNRDENLASHLHMGDQVIVTGDLNIENTDNGTFVKCIVDSLEFGAQKR